MKVRPASKADINDVLGCVRRIKREYFEANNIPQWNDDYPSREIFSADVDKKSLYVMHMGEVLVGFGVFSAENEPTYNEIDGEWLTDGGNYLVVHRFGINPDWHGMGMGSALIGLADKICEVKKIPSIRVDTHESNISMQKLLEKCGYKKCGTIHLQNGDPRIAFEKII